MIGNRKLILDTFCEVYDLLFPWSDGEFFDFSEHIVVPGAIYVIGRAQINHNRHLIRELVERGTIRAILSNPAEGSQTLADHCDNVHCVGDLVKSNKMLLIGGGEMSAEWPYLLYDSFMSKILDYTENLKEIDRAKELYTKTDKPYKFLFLNGRIRGHRKYLIERFNINGLLDHAIWTCLDAGYGGRINLTLPHNGQDLMMTYRSTKLLDPHYEVDRYQSRVGIEHTDSFVKYQLFDNEWGDIYLKAEPYIDTYFSVVTETVFEYPYSFRTEKIWKPIAMGQPWICASSRGYYRDMQNLGFRTFGHLIDESFDQIDNNLDRLSRVATVVEDLCQQDLPAFLAAAEETCKYNQQHLAEMRTQVRQEFPDRFFKFLGTYQLC
jgi:hypothetical protein